MKQTQKFQCEGSHWVFSFSDLEILSVRVTHGPPTNGFNPFYNIESGTSSCSESCNMGGKVIEDGICDKRWCSRYSLSDFIPPTCDSNFSIARIASNGPIRQVSRFRRLGIHSMKSSTEFATWRSFISYTKRNVLGRMFLKFDESKLELLTMPYPWLRRELMDTWERASK